MARRRVKKQTKRKTSRSFLKHPLFIPGLIVSLGILLIFASLALKIHAATQLSFAGDYTPPKISAKDKIVPKEVIIPKINVSLPIYGTVIKNGAWQIAKDGVSYLSDSAGIAQKNTTILYAHNTKDRFKDLPKLAPGDTVIIKGSDGKLHLYKVAEIKTVNFNDVKVLKEKRPETLILYTCVGFADLKRFLVFATPTN